MIIKNVSWFLKNSICFKAIFCIFFLSLDYGYLQSSDRLPEPDILAKLIDSETIRRNKMIKDECQQRMQIHEAILANILFNSRYALLERIEMRKIARGIMQQLGPKLDEALAQNNNVELVRLCTDQQPFENHRCNGKACNARDVENLSWSMLQPSTWEALRKQRLTNTRLYIWWENKMRNPALQFFANSTDRSTNPS